MIKFLTTKHLLLLTICSFLLARGLTLELFDLSEPTESRYATIAGDMVHSGNWITPQFPRGLEHEPYLGKPPLYFWLVAFSQKTLGFDEWTERLPSFISTIISGGLIYLAGSLISAEIAFSAVLIWLGTAFVYFFSGSVMVDPVLSVFITASLTSTFILNRESNLSKLKKFFLQMLFWICLSAGFLTKGPVAIIFIGLPVIGISLVNRSLSHFKSINLLVGLPLSILIITPWFYLAELENPGFIRYFFVNENFLRFFVKNYGDKYGTGHRYPYGSVWWMLLAGMLPWSFYILRLIPERKIIVREIKRNKDLQFFICWGLSIPLFLTFMKQMHPGYLLPAFPGICLSLACIRQRSVNNLSLIWDIYLRKIVKLLFIALLITISIYSYYRPFDWGRLTLLALGILVSIGILLRARTKNWENFTPLMRLTDISFSVFAIFFVTSIILSKEISEKTSPSSIFRCLVKSLPNNLSINVGFVSNRSYTAHYLNDTAYLELDRDINVSLVKEPITDNQHLEEHLIVKEKYSGSIPKNHFRKIHQIKDYIWYSKLESEIKIDPSCITDRS